jgi:hypothetical protein
MCHYVDYTQPVVRGLLAGTRSKRIAAVDEGKMIRIAPNLDVALVRGA